MAKAKEKERTPTPEELAIIDAHCLTFHFKRIGQPTWDGMTWNVVAAHAPRARINLKIKDPDK